MDYYIRGKERVTLIQNDFIASGGEGSIFGKNNTIYKVFHSSQKMIPVAKIDELQVLSDPNILKPLDVLLDKQNNPIGFTMRWIKDAGALTKLFSNDFRKRNGATNITTVELVENMKKTTKSIHDCNCLIIDGNPFNYMVDSKKFIIPYFIDVGTYQTPHFPATAIMLTIKDWHTKIFSEMTDWFSFAIVSFQLFCGIHPYRGGYPGYKTDELERRMKDNISVLNPKTSVPPSVRDFSCIPEEYFKWYLALFEKGERTGPPSLPGTISIVPIKIITIQSTDSFRITSLREFNSDILYYQNIFNNEIIKTEGKPNLHINKTSYHVTYDTEVIFTKQTETPIFVKVENQQIKFKSLQPEKIIQDLTFNCIDKMIVNNSLFVLGNGTLTEISFYELGNKIIPTVSKQTQWNIMPLSSEMFSGVIYEDVLGKPFLVIPVTKSKTICVIIPVPELEKCRIIDAKHDNGVCIIIGHNGSEYIRFIFRFDKNFNNYDCRITKSIIYYNTNFVTLDNGVVISIIEDEVLEVFFRDPTKNQVKEIHDPDIDTTMRLCKSGVKTMFFKQNKVYKIELKK